MFKQSVRGLAVGAPVDFRGVTIGEVIRIGVEFDPKAFNFVQPVEIYLYPDRLRVRSGDMGAALPVATDPGGAPEALRSSSSSGAFAPSCGPATCSPGSSTSRSTSSPTRRK